MKCRRDTGVGMKEQASRRHLTRELSLEELADRAGKLAVSEQALRRQSRILYSVLSCIGEGLVVADETGRMILFNPAAEAIVGIGLSHAAPDSWPATYGIYYPDGTTPYPSNEVPLARAIRGEATDDVELFIRNPHRPQGIFVSCIGRPLTNERGEITGGVVVFRDITKRHEIEAAKDEFISTVSHELRTPITSILGALGLIAGGALGPISDKVRVMVELAHRSGQRLSRLVNDILDLSKIEAGKIVLKCSPQEITPLVEAAVSNARGFAERYGVAVMVTGRLPGVRVTVDADRFEQVLANLLSNAVKFSPAGASVDVSVARHESRIRVSVADRGPGIPDSFRGRIFQKFSQADGSDNRRKGGTGLGLSIARALAERLGGRLSFDSRPGEGARFFFDLAESIPS